MVLEAGVFDGRLPELFLEDRQPMGAGVDDAKGFHALGEEAVHYLGVSLLSRHERV